ncbi:hypothetical protein Tco_0802357 [Tanacetum coccineum]|uniref:CCHC-type domain-containing protein n=1 Tax=Tanacetum coccineum TaxID=301880 RepID=A0ABQ4ZYK1_9ASTR
MDNTIVVNALPKRMRFGVNQDPGVKFSQDPPQIGHNCCYECGDSLDGIFCQQCICKFCGKGTHYGYNCPPKVPIIFNPEQYNQTINELPQILPNENSFIYDSKPNSFNVSPMFYQPSTTPVGTYLCEGSKVQKKEQAYEEEKYYAACRYMLYVTCDDEDDYIPLGDIIARNSTSKSITPDLSIEEPNNSLNTGDEHLDTSLGQWNSIGPILVEFAGELAHIAPIPPGINEAYFDPNDNTSSDDDGFEDIEYVSLEEVNDVNQKEKEFDLDDILQIQDVILHEKLLNVSRLISNIESLKDNPIPVMDSDSSITSLSFSDNSLPEFESFSDYSEETRSGNTTTHANYSLLEYESFHFDNPSFPRPPPEPPDVEILESKINNFVVLYNVEPFKLGESESIVVSNVEEDDSFTFTIRTFLPFLTYPEVSPLSCSTGSEDLIFDPDIITFHFLKPLAFLWKFLSFIFAFPKDN